MKRIILVLLRSILFAMKRVGIIKQNAYTSMYIKILQRQGCDIAPYSNCGYIDPSVHFDGYDRTLIHIGEDVYLTYGVILLVHDQSVVTVYNYEKKDKCNGGLNHGSMYNPQPIYIGSNVFIGMRSIVLPGTTIGDDVVIGAGSVVKGRIPSGSVWCGNPAKEIKAMHEQYDSLKKRNAFSEG